eukprot:1763671-Pleurochrysis_carterae.AAC.1
MKFVSKLGRGSQISERANHKQMVMVLPELTFSDLKLMGVEYLREQLKMHKLLGKTGFALSLPNRT